MAAEKVFASFFCLFALASACAFSQDASIEFHNSDGVGHAIAIDRNNQYITVYPQEVVGGDSFTVPSGGSASTMLRPGRWSVYGDGNYRFDIMIAAGNGYSFTLQPFTQNSSLGVSYGLLGLVNDGYNTRSYQLYDLAQVPPPYPNVPPVVIVEQPSYYYPAPPPPYYPPYRYDKGRALGEAIGSAVFDILGEALSDDHGHRRHRW